MFMSVEGNLAGKRIVLSKVERKQSNSQNKCTFS